MATLKCRYWVGLLLATILWTGCDFGPSSDSDDGSSAPSTTSGGTTSGSTTGGSTTGGTTTGGTTGGLLSGVSFVGNGQPTGGYAAITDLVVFQNRLYVASSVDPLGSFGTSVICTADGSTFQRVLSDSTSQGYLRMQIFDNQMYVPDGDPNGYDPSYVYISADGVSFRQTIVQSGWHTFDVIKFQGDLLCSNGLSIGAGLCKTPDNGASPWRPLGSYSPQRFKYMAQFGGRLFVGRDNSGGEGDLWRWSGDVDTNSGQEINVFPGGSSSTFNWYVTARNRLFWSVAESGGQTLRLMRTDDGNAWTEVPGFRNDFVSDLVEFGGNLYVLAQSGLWGSTDHSTFVKIAGAPAGAFDLDPYTPEAIGAIAVWNGKLWCGSNRNGRLYRIE